MGGCARTLYEVFWVLTRESIPTTSDFVVWVWSRCVVKAVSCSDIRRQGWEGGEDATPGASQRLSHRLRGRAGVAPRPHKAVDGLRQAETKICVAFIPGQRRNEGKLVGDLPFCTRGSKPATQFRLAEESDVATDSEIGESAPGAAGYDPSFAWASPGPQLPCPAAAAS